ncbi:hypothetical protein K402DRAFT_418301 [Aulographum hederae CBS 113979]|uniref:Uncharacterized protein n=1 Tax=Aulographum hederae CBS 113979 TaxID=1176131 RepID=A0A6G1H981_9PEZI|nr:hypothetical protein K402DRAFT_418301 [Aulographum hederae CBS 113979]
MEQQQQFINRALALMLGLHIDQSEAITINIGNGDEMVLNDQVTFCVDIHGVLATKDAYVVDGDTTYSILFSRGFLSAVGAVDNFRDDQITFLTPMGEVVDIPRSNKNSPVPRDVPISVKSVEATHGSNDSTSYHDSESSILSGIFVSDVDRDSSDDDNDDRRPSIVLRESVEIRRMIRLRSLATTPMPTRRREKGTTPGDAELSGWQTFSGSLCERFQPYVTFQR